MPTKTNIPYTNGIYFITFTCSNWINLFEICNAYDLVYKWFNYLIEQGNYIVGYVIMPNHLHAIIAFKDNKKNINTIISNGKRFMAYEIVKRLYDQKHLEILNHLQSIVSEKEKAKNKIHRVFEPSFDWKECNNETFINQKLDYIHMNPCHTKEPLVEQPQDYIYSSAKFYINGVQDCITIINSLELDDIDLS